MDKIIFLDIDGPMIPSTQHLVDRMSSFNRKCPATTIAVLNLMCERTGAKIVFNTSHNVTHSNVPNIDVALMEQGVDPDYLHPTDRHTRYPHIPRAEAVREWLAKHPEVQKWVALDDAKFMKDRNLIWIDPDAGLHTGHLNTAIKKLGGKPVLILM